MILITELTLMDILYGFVTIKEFQFITANFSDKLFPEDFQKYDEK